MWQRKGMAYMPLLIFSADLGDYSFQHAKFLEQPC